MHVSVVENHNKQIILGPDDMTGQSPGQPRQEKKEVPELWVLLTVQKEITKGRNYEKNHKKKLLKKITKKIGFFIN